MNWQPSAAAHALRARAGLLAQTRAFFAQRDVLEVQTPVLSRFAISTPQIDSFEVMPGARYLRTSPELAHKRLLAAGLGDIYELGPVFRVGEQGAHHGCEFTLLEWYRLGFDEHALMTEVAQLLAQCVPTVSGAGQRLRYADALLEHAGLDLWCCGDQDIANVLTAHTRLPDAQLARDELLDLVFAVVIAPTFDPGSVTFLYDYPASQAVLAALSDDDPRVARRFEAYVGELELANGFFELRDGDVQRARFAQDNALRAERGQRECPPDEAFLSALESGLPACAGVALGFDRMVMLATGERDIRATLAFEYDQA